MEKIKKFVEDMQTPVFLCALAVIFVAIVVAAYRWGGEALAVSVAIMIAFAYVDDISKIIKLSK